MDGAKALKGWLAAMLRQLSLIVQRNPAVFKSKTKLIRLGLDPANGNRGSGVDCLVELSAEGVLTIVQNMESAAKPDPTVSQRVDGVLDVTMANLQSEVSSEMTMRSQALSNALRIPGLAVNLDFSFESDPVFYALPPQSKAAKIKRLRGHVESTLDALIKCGPEACVGLVAVLVCCDGSNETRDVFTGATDADHYLTVLDRDGLLRVTLNLESVEKSLGRLHHKIEQQLALHRARQDTTYHAGPEFFDWESLQSCGLLLNDSILVAFEASISHCKESVRAFARAVHKSRSETPAGRDALARIQTLRVCMEREQQDLWRTRLHDESTLVLSLSLQFVKDKSRIEELDWKESLEWTLHYATVEVEKFHAEKCKAAAEAALSKAFGAPLQIRIDWPVYIDRPEFKDLGASGCRAAIRELSTELLNSIVHGVSAIAQHPVGAKALKEKVKNITISYGPNVDVAQRLMEPCKVSLLPGSELLISFRNLHDSVSVNYKSRVEFELGIVVAVAEFDATARREAVSKALGGHPLNYSLDSFQKSDEYRFGVAIADQPAIVDAVVAGVAEHVFASQSDGLVAVWSRAKAVVKSTLVELSVNRSLTTTFGRLELRAGGVLALTLDLGSVLQVKNSRNWRSRIASVCGFLDDLSKEECNEKLSKTSQKLSLSPVVIEWTEVFAALKHLPAADRYERAHNLGGELARDVLLGYWGLEGLASFPKIKSELQSRVKQISLTIAAGSGGGTYKTEMQGTTLRIVFPLDETREWNKSNKQGCRERVEALLSLRPMVEAEAIEEQEHAHVQPTAVQISKKVLVDWQKLLGSADYRAVRDYVAYIRYVGSFIPKCLVGYGDKPEGLHWMLATNAQAKEFFTTISTIEIVIDGDCKEKPAQERFVNARMSCVKKAPSSIVLTVRRDWMETDEDDNGLQRNHFCFVFDLQMCHQRVGNSAQKPDSSRMWNCCCK
jgi:hypothetical protein